MSQVKCPAADINQLQQQRISYIYYELPIMLASDLMQDANSQCPEEPVWHSALKMQWP